ncbi:hypothetical protein QTP86_017627 [Hemibagrus guttatus]|nr:hypothetical protein QTP86_017627 [Hemibagrus guttatus]
MSMADPNTKLCVGWTRRHEECGLAVSNVVGHENIVSASRMNSAIVVFLNDVEKVRKLTQNGIVVNNEMILVSPLSSPAKKVMLCNVPPFISDAVVGKELSRYGRTLSPIKKIPLGCKSPLVRHWVWFRRMVFMVFKEGVEELTAVFKFTVDLTTIYSSLLIQTLSVLSVVKQDILFGPALRGRVTPVFLSDRGGTRPSRLGSFPLPLHRT